MVSDKCVDHGAHGDQREQRGRNSPHFVTKVEKTNSQRSKNHGEVQPREECSLVGKKHLRLDPGGQSNSLAGSYVLARSQRGYPRSFPVTKAELAEQLDALFKGDVSEYIENVLAKLTQTSSKYKYVVNAHLVDSKEADCGIQSFFGAAWNSSTDGTATLKKELDNGWLVVTIVFLRRE
ncbi:hypothetical protein KL920_004135 [Ogataea angusta]|nr:hypothetical protein KL920_004135 [Ogataea angusta]